MSYMYISLLWWFYVPHIALSLASDREKLLKEVTTMLSFKHPNVMSLIGVCIDGEMPLIIMPYMSHGNVLGYVKQNKGELHFPIDQKVNQEEVINNILLKQNVDTKCSYILR